MIGGDWTVWHRGLVGQFATFQRTRQQKAEVVHDNQRQFQPQSRQAVPPGHCLHAGAGFLGSHAGARQRGELAGQFAFDRFGGCF